MPDDKQDHSAFKIVLDQYNKNIAFGPDISMKVIGACLVFYGFFLSAHKTSHDLDKTTATLICIITFAFGLLYIGMMMAYHTRCANASRYMHRTWQALNLPEPAEMGVLDEEHSRIYFRWGMAAVIMLCSIIVITPNYIGEPPCPR